MRALPGVESAATTFAPPFFTNYGSNTIEVYSRQMPYIVVGQLTIRASGNPTELIPRVREAIAGVDSRLAIASMDTMDTLMKQSVANERYRATLSSAFGGAALLLAAIGLSACSRAR